MDGGTTAPDLAVAPERRRLPLPGRPLGLRARILLGFVAMLALATVASVLVARQLVVEQLDNRIDRDLVQETQELRRLAGGVDPATGRPFGARVRRIFDVFFARNVASRNEAMLAATPLMAKKVAPARRTRMTVSPSGKRSSGVSGSTMT